MRNLILLFCISFLITACDDGDIITVELDFSDEPPLRLCDNNEDSFLIFDTRNEPSESLSLIIPRNDTNELLFSEPTPLGQPVTMQINGSTVRFNYRTYNRDIVGDELCNIIPPADLIINEDFEAPSGTVEITSTVIDDDNDGVPTEFENQDPNGDGDFSDAQDTDEDGIPDYIDSDDDNDNVPTSLELNNNDVDDEDPTTNPLDTDGDGIPNYLDNDDDEDGVLTRFEDEDGDGPLDDISIDSQGNEVADYLNDEVAGAFEGMEPQPTMYTRIVASSFLLRDIDIEILRTDVINLGTFVGEPIPMTQEN